MTGSEVVREESEKWELSRPISDEMIEYILFEKTGFPCFWPDPRKTPEENLRIQVREFFEQSGKKRKEQP